MFAPFGIGGAFGSSDALSGRRGPTRAQAKAADVEDAAEEEAREDRHALVERGS